MEVFPNWTAIPIIIFVMTMVWILNRTFFVPLGKTLEERHSRIEGARLEAEEIRRVSAGRLQEFEARMRAARRESDQNMAQIKNAALAERNQIVSARRVETEKMLGEARNQIRRKTEEARRVLEMQSQLFAYQIAAQILKRPVQRKRTAQV